jgi:hypothetical protein
MKSGWATIDSSVCGQLGGCVVPMEHCADFPSLRLIDKFDGCMGLWRGVKHGNGRSRVGSILDSQLSTRIRS